MRTALIATILCVATTHASAEHWYRGPDGNHRVFHVSLTVALGAGFLISEGLIKKTLASDHCRWCDPTGVDVSVRDALVWDKVGTARTLSDLTGYLGAPGLGIGVTVLTVLSRDDASWAQLIDDTFPVLETLAISQAVTQAVKFTVARERPFVHYGSPAPTADDNLSFWSGHSALAFGAVTSAGFVAHRRHSKLEPLIWGVGLPLAATTAYLRIAGDKHYFTDVVVGSVVGVVSGLTIPRLMLCPSVVVVPAPNGVSLAGAF
ncbi:MAG: phosphatase PAP2 family protein [Myxococcales bacterium]|nr:phosphatase PAP2 family protein [Myxococcales bacterium]